MTVLEQLLLALSISGQVTLIVIALCIWHLVKTMQTPHYVPVLVPANRPVLATVPALGLRGGAIEFTLPDGHRSVADMNSNQVFANLAGVRMIAVFQEAS